MNEVGKFLSPNISASWLKKKEEKIVGVEKYLTDRKHLISCCSLRPDR